MINPFMLITILGSIASIVGLLIAQKDLKSKIIHGVYGFIIAIIVGLSIIYVSDINQKLEDKSKEIEILKSIENEVNEILKSEPLLYAESNCRGFLFSSFAFLEKHKKRFPNTYSLAKEYLENGLKINKYEGTFSEEERLKKGMKVMKSFLLGLKGNMK